MEFLPESQRPERIVQLIEDEAAIHGDIREYLADLHENLTYAELIKTLGYAARLINDEPHEIHVQGYDNAFFEGGLIGLCVAAHTVEEHVLMAMNNTDAASSAILMMDEMYVGDSDGDSHVRRDDSEESQELFLLSHKGFKTAPYDYRQFVQDWAPLIAEKPKNEPFIELGFGYVWSMIEEAKMEVDEEQLDEMYQQLEALLRNPETF